MRATRPVVAGSRGSSASSFFSSTSDRSATRRASARAAGGAGATSAAASGGPGVGPPGSGERTSGGWVEVDVDVDVGGAGDGAAVFEHAEVGLELQQPAHGPVDVVLADEAALDGIDERVRVAVGVGELDVEPGAERERGGR